MLRRLDDRIERWLGLPEIRLLRWLAEGFVRLAETSLLLLWLILLLVFEERPEPGAAPPVSWIVAGVALAHLGWRLASIHRALISSRQYRWADDAGGVGQRLFTYAILAGLALGALGARPALAGDPATILTHRALWLAALDLGLTAAVLAGLALHRTLAPYRPGGPRAPLLRGEPALAFGVGLARLGLALVRWLLAGLLLAGVWPAMLIARQLRLRRETPYLCQHEGCGLRFEDPPLVCRRCHGGEATARPLRTWPCLEAPLFAVCPACQTVHPTWWPLARASAAGTVRFWHPTCPFSCHRFGRDGRPGYRLLLLCLGIGQLPAVLTRGEAWLGSASLNARAKSGIAELRQLAERGLHVRLPRRPVSARLESRSSRRRLQIDLTRPPEARLWAGDYDGVLVLPRRCEGAAEDLEREVAFALNRLELPLAPRRRLSHNRRLPSRWHRLLLPSVNPTDDELPHRLRTRLGVWTAHNPSFVPLRGNLGSLEYRGQPVHRVADAASFETFLEETAP